MSRELRDFELKLIRGGSRAAHERVAHARDHAMLHAGGAFLAAGAVGALGHVAAMGVGYAAGGNRLARMHKLGKTAKFLASRQRGGPFGRAKQKRRGAYV